MIQKIIISTVFLLKIISLQAQELDRVSLSSGGSSTDEVNYVIGETFNFTMSDGANVTIETGTLGSVGNTGGVNTYTNLELLMRPKPLACYPNPAKEVLFFTTGENLQTDLIITIYDFSGKIVTKQKAKNANIMRVNINNLVTGTYFLSVFDKKNNLIGSAKFVKQ